ncbi:PQQ-dependent dehydrogenase, methanol/ethanol family [Sphingomonas sp. 3P27F8]|uniref:PQQ-dependent dehydrogenase, methanol/ethanol family n=1 Tax=Sphingomonas sp. 3P27F8 TaxID=2502213 RepID=UPI0010F77E9C|nr:PQQ-dependent dehydrogenase, methanol/ethanol family [Sphingomonas sp. 3P27F8]
MKASRHLGIGALALSSALVLASCSQGGAVPADTAWSDHGGDPSEKRFSPLTQINASTVGRLGLAWSLDLPDENSLEATPIEVAGTLYFSGGTGKVYAVDVVSGKQKWEYDAAPVEHSSERTLRIYNINRGVAYWDGKIYYASRDGRMIALDAKTGKEVWVEPFLIAGDGATSTGAPRVFKGKVIIGNSGADSGARGYVTTMDARTGKILWRFFTVPGNPAVDKDDTTKMAAGTWAGEWWKYGGGGTPWNGITYDAEFNQILIGTGNGAPYNWRFRAPPGKDNLFLASVVAVDADTGKYKWHYQYNPREAWDWKATTEIILADVKFKGQDRKVLIQAPTNAFAYMIDRSNGKLLTAEKVGKANWADRIDLATGRPVEKPGIRYESGSATIYPGIAGGHNWIPGSYNPKTGLYYIPYLQVGMKFTETAQTRARPDVDVKKNRYIYGIDIDSVFDPKDPLDGKGALIAYDPVAGKVRWTNPLQGAGGTATTAGGLVFQGDMDGIFHAWDATSGKELWRFDAKLGITAPPITYAFKGKQYVSLLISPAGMYGENGRPNGWVYGLQPRRLLTFALDAKAQLPATPPRMMKAEALDDPSIKLDPARVEKGGILYHLQCTFCHGATAVAGGTAPDLRGSSAALQRESFRAIVKGGALTSRAMPRFDKIDDDELENLWQYIRFEARNAKKNDK